MQENIDIQNKLKKVISEEVSNDSLPEHLREIKTNRYDHLSKEQLEKLFKLIGD